MWARFESPGGIGGAHLPNGLAPKMDGAPAGDRCPTTDMILSQCVGGRRGCNAAFGVSLSEAASGASL